MSHDTWIHRGVRTLVRPLARTPVTPNHLTTARLFTGLGAAAAFTTGEDSWIRAGAVLFVVSMAFDRADGELARVSGKTSRFGHFFDLATDAVCNAAVLAGIGVGLRAGAFGDWAILMGLTAGLSVASIFYMVIRIEQQLGQGSSAFDPQFGVDPDDAMIVIPIVMWLGYGEALLAAAAVMAPLSMIIIAVVFRRRGRDRR
ncbi:MAG: CDP-alcohol phosphatidyltransferase family protein [Gammaproteobacteria bacterium]|nr:CDP-alcohol phosphatidyltransferase family protein [Gammaproteobacteria bacterium]MDH3413220.1 CDP-alcohol phosphatidyltransferase family protein [Gammaproteobacteria bacterium]